MRARERAEALAKKPFRVWDLVVYGVLAAAFLLSFLPQLARAERAVSTVEVLVDGKLFATLSLDSDTALEIDGRLTVVVSDGVVTVRDAHCADKICEHMRIASASDQIVCAPQGIVIRAADAFGTGEIGAGQ